MKEIMTWNKDEEGANCKLNDNYTLFITKVEGGLRIKTYEMKKNGEKHKLLFTEFIGDGRLGHLLPPDKDKDK